MKRKFFAWDDLDEEKVDLIVKTYVIHFRHMDIDSTEQSLRKILNLVAPNVIIEYDKGIVKAFKFDYESLCYMRALSQSSITPTIKR